MIIYNFKCLECGEEFEGEKRLTDKMYISGTYWVAKKDFMIKTH